MNEEKFSEDLPNDDTSSDKSFTEAEFGDGQSITQDENNQEEVSQLDSVQEEQSEQELDNEAQVLLSEASEEFEAPAQNYGMLDGVVIENMRWYILHTYSGFEQRVEQTINEMVRNGQSKNLIARVVVPTERVEELGKGGEKRTTKRKFYPGYVMIQMAMTDFSWYLIQNIPKVTGFVGGKNRPSPMRDSEAEKILQLMKERQETPRPKFNFERGEEVRVIDGPFGGFNGVVDEVNYDKGKLKVSVSIFGRQTPVELDFIQVSKG